MSISAEAAMVLLREAMEGLLHHELVAATIFEALGVYGGEMPNDGPELQHFVEGPLKRALLRKTDEATTSSVLILLAPILQNIQEAEPEEPKTDPQARPLVDEDPVTEPLARPTEPYVLVIASTEALERRLRLALGSKLDVATATGVVAMHAKILGHSPRLVIVDATEAPTFAPREILRALARNVPGAVTAVWGCYQPYAHDLADEQPEPAPMGLSVEEGVAPLLDLCRSFGMPLTEPRTDGMLRPTPAVGTLQPARRTVNTPPPE